METKDLPEDIVTLIQHISNWQFAIRSEVASILLKLWNGEELSRSENGLEVSPAELAAIWSVVNKTPIQVRHVREVKRDGRIEPSKVWGKGPGARSLYKVRDTKDVRVSHEHGRPLGSKNKKPRRVERHDTAA